MTDRTPAEILTEAADILERNVVNNWGQRAYFQDVTEKGCTMCAHGAIAYAGIPLVREKLFQVKPAGTNTGAEWAAARAAGVRAAEAEAARTAAANYKAPSYITEKTTHMAHFYAMKSGLTFDYNDAKERTKEEVISKLREAAALAKSCEESKVAV